MTFRDFLKFITTLASQNTGNDSVAPDKSHNQMGRSRKYSAGEERANTYSHALGIGLGVVGGYFLLQTAIASHDPWVIGSVAAYLFGMLASYITSTLYHGCTRETQKRQLQKLDHAAIYLHIAGTYTPFTLIVLWKAGAWGWALFAFAWAAAIAGTWISFKKSGKHSYIETICYVVMGTVILLALNPLINALKPAGQIDALYWLIAGGVSYVIGATFYSLAKIRYMHTVFHLFVLGGSVCHLIAIYLILPR